MLARNAVVFPQMAFGLVPKILNSINMVMPINIRFKMTDPIVFKFRYIQYILRRQTIRIHDTIRPYLGVDYPFQSLRFGVRQYLCVDFSITLKDTKYCDFPRSSATSYSSSIATKVAFIDFHLTREHLH